MFRSSISFGRWFGVEVRMHLSLLALLALSLAYSLAVTGGTSRGLGLWLALLLAIVIRELARGAALLREGVVPRALVLFPFGGLLALESGAPAPGRVAANVVAFPLLGNLLTGLLLLGFSYSITPGVRLLEQPWISAGHLLRSLVWIQFLVAAFNLLPTPSPIAASRWAAHGGASSQTRRSSTPAAGWAIALALLLGGMLLAKPWLAGLGCFALLGAQLGRRQSHRLADAGSTPVRELMLTRFVSLSNSDTVSEALRASAGSLQDVFPVLRGDRLVGAVSAEALGLKLRTEGDGYVQRDMQRSLHLASPGDPLGETLGRAAALGAPDFVPVVKDGRVLGILTPAGVAAAFRALRVAAPGAKAAGNGGPREPRDG